ncbi:hypothetical protein ACFZAD_29955, partial [Streptomyces iakyrus]|uniref:hypothetical protein n=1 Tax=Streptomyces iakyrus TaxID=68219 RepID=UPI0036F122FA
QDAVRVGVAGVGEGVRDEDDPVGGTLAQALDSQRCAVQAGAQGLLELACSLICLRRLRTSS